MKFFDLEGPAVASIVADAASKTGVTAIASAEHKIATMPRSIAATARVKLATLVAILFANSAAPGSMSAQPPVPRPPADAAAAKQALARARAQLESSDFRAAELAYASVLQTLPAGEQTLLGAAHFGNAFAAQQRFMNGDTLLNRVVIDSVIAHYHAAELLDPAALGAEANNNVGILLRSAGRHEEALRYFRRAVQSTSSSNDLRSGFLVNLGGEFEVTKQLDSAASAYTTAVGLASNRTAALQSLYAVLVRTFPAERLIASAMKWCQDTTYAPEVNSSLLKLLQRDRPAVDSVRAIDALLLMVGTWPVLRVGPQYYRAVLRAQLVQVAALHPDLRGAIDALNDAYEVRSEKAMYLGKPSAAWWTSLDQDADVRLANGRPKTNGRPAPVRLSVWSSVLRSLGDQYEARANLGVARSYYEAALGGSEFQTEAPWADRGALLPLAVIYARLSQSSDTVSANAVRLQQSIDRFTRQLFAQKMQAYSAGDLNRIHEMHLTLGTFYASTGKWTGGDPQNATYQLEHMRTASRALQEQTGVAPADPPELLEKLAIRYRAVGDTSKAVNVVDQIERQYRVRGNTSAAAAARGRVFNAKASVAVPPAIVKRGVTTVDTTRRKPPG